MLEKLNQYNLFIKGLKDKSFEELKKTAHTDNLNAVLYYAHSYKQLKDYEAVINDTLRNELENSIEVSLTEWSEDDRTMPDCSPVYFRLFMELYKFREIQLIFSEDVLSYLTNAN